MSNKALKFISIALALMLTGCSSSIEAPEDSQIVGLATPITLEFEETEIISADYFIAPSRIDSVTAPAGLQASLSPDKEVITLSGSLQSPLDVLNIWAGGYAYDFLLKRSSKQEITMTFEQGSGSVNSVKMKGEMNNWNPNATVFEKNGDIWEATMLVNEGVYQYVLVIDGQEMPDPDNPNTV
ncbi:MAG TPA: hypothetical protein DD671_11430, partial [Balneolaceae bacterium]|nr:hypothetical protein [Balneolaceae bacterium]